METSRLDSGVTSAALTTSSIANDQGSDTEPPDVRVYLAFDGNTTVGFDIAVTLMLGTGIMESDDGNVSLTTEVPDYYDYDQDGQGSSLALDLVPLTIFYILTFLLGLIGNVLVIFSILRYRRMRNVTNIFLTSLATADLLLVMLCVPIKVIPLSLITFQ